jgi:hypothetical protein
MNEENRPAGVNRPDGCRDHVSGRSRKLLRPHVWRCELGCGFRFHGPFAPSSTTDSLSWSVGGDTGWVVGGAIGYDLNEILRGWKTELEFSYRENKREGDWSSRDLHREPETASCHLTTRPSPSWRMPGTNFRSAASPPMFGGGIGWARSTFKGDYINGLERAKPFDFDNSGFAWQLGRGRQLPHQTRHEHGPRLSLFPRTRSELPFPLAMSPGAARTMHRAMWIRKATQYMLNLDVSL